MLRAVPHKRLGVLCMAAAILVLFFLPLLGTMGPVRCWVFAVNFMALMWLGANPPAAPFLFISQCSTVLYFALLAGRVFRFCGYLPCPGNTEAFLIYGLLLFIFCLIGGVVGVVGLSLLSAVVVPGYRPHNLEGHKLE